MAMKILFDVCSPRDDIMRGNIQEVDFAADLAQVINQTAPEIYRNPSLFFKNTHPTKGLRDLIRTVCQRLRGEEGIAVLRLDTQYGGGKTHSLIALTHAVSGMVGVDNTAEFIDPALLPQEKVNIASFDGENADPGNGRPLEEGIRAYTPWGELAYALGQKRGYELISRSDQERVAPGADTLRELFGDAPTLILLDELSIYLRKIKGRREEGQLTAFLTSLFKAVSSSPKACVVFTLAIGKEGKAQDAYAQENEFVAEKLEEAVKVAGRVATLLNPTTEQETVKVLRRRLFSEINDGLAQEAIAAYQQLWIQNQSALSPLSPEQVEQFREGYPFHPALMSLLTDKLSTLSTFQRVRGMLRLLTRTVAELWRQKPPQTYALHLHHVNPGYEPIRNEINTKLELSRFAPVIENDVSALEGESLAQILDRRFYGGLAPYASFVARNILWHTFAFNEALQGIDKKNLSFSILAPGLETGFINDACDKFTKDSAYLDDRPTAPLKFLTEVNLLQLIRRQMEVVDLTEARTQLQDRVQKIFEGKTFNLRLFPQGPYEIPDDEGNGRPYLVVLSYDAVSISETIQVPDLVESIYQYQGSKGDFRHLVNNLVFLVADASKREDMKEKMKYRLALEAMRKPDKLQQLPEHQQDKVKELHQRSEQEIAVLIQQCYRHLFYPSHSKVEGSNVNLAHTMIDLPSASQKPGDGQQQIIQSLLDNRRLILAGGDPPNPSAVRDATILKNKGQISTAELRSEFRQNIKLSMVIGDDPFIRMIRDGVGRNLWVYKYGDLLFGQGDPYAEIKIDEQAFIYTVDYAKESGIWPRQPKPLTQPSSPSSSGSSFKDGPGSYTGTGSGQTGIIDAPISPPPDLPIKPRTIKHEAPLRQALTQVWEDARSFGIQRISQMTVRVFDVSDAFKLMGAIAKVSSGQITVRLEASYETQGGSNLELEFEGVIADISPIQEFLRSQFRASAETSLNTVFTITYAEGLSLTGGEPETFTDQLARFATGTALVEVTAEGN